MMCMKDNPQMLAAVKSQTSKVTWRRTTRMTSKRNQNRCEDNFHAHARMTHWMTGSIGAVVASSALWAAKTVM